MKLLLLIGLLALLTSCGQTKTNYVRWDAYGQVHVDRPIQVTPDVEVRHNLSTTKPAQEGVVDKLKKMLPGSN